MWRSLFGTIAAQLRLLLGALLVLLIVAFAVPAWNSIQQALEARQVAVTARAGQDVFTALQYLRPERGTVQAALNAPGPAEPALSAALAAMRTHASPALESVLRDCIALRCAADDPRLEGFRRSLEHLNAVRQEADAAMRNERAERPSALVAAWQEASTDAVTRLDHLNSSLTERVRLADGPIAELMAIKQLGWLVRDAAGLQRNIYSDGINAKGLSAGQVTQIATFQGRIESGWAALRSLTGRQGMSPRLVSAIDGAMRGYFGTVDAQRVALQAALSARRDPPISLTDWLRVSTEGLDSLIAVPNAAVVEAQSYAEQRAVDAVRRLTLQLGLLLFGAVLGSVGLLLVQRRIVQPIRIITATMRELAKGNMVATITGHERHDEIGEMAGALGVFRDGLVRAEAIAGERESERQRATAEKHAALAGMGVTIQQETQSVLDEVSQRTAALGAVADQMAGSAERTGMFARETATMAGSALETAQTVAGTADALAHSIRDINVQIGRTTEAIGRAVAAGGQARGAIQALNEQVGQIGTVADMISEIAERTNLLALNATIEAARAGEAGKGFAVVASEVKALANQTAHSTGQISRHISEVRAATGASITAVQKIETTISEVEEVASSIAAVMQEQHGATAEIAHNVLETTNAVRIVSGHADKLAGEAQVNARHVVEVRDTAASLNDTVIGMKRAVTRIVRTAA